MTELYREDVLCVCVCVFSVDAVHYSKFETFLLKIFKVACTLW